jgi:hypothetical protein
MKHSSIKLARRLDASSGRSRMDGMIEMNLIVSVFRATHLIVTADRIPTVSESSTRHSWRSVFATGVSLKNSPSAAAALLRLPAVGDNAAMQAEQPKRDISLA